MSTKVKLDSFPVAGISMRVDSNCEIATKQIGEMWQKFMSGGYDKKVKNIVSPEIYAVYTDYDFSNGMDYKMLIGFKVSDVDIEDELDSVNICSGDYNKYIAIGKIPESIIKVWEEVWDSKTARSHKTDFEVYGEKAKNMENAEVEIYVGS